MQDFARSIEALNFAERYLSHARHGGFLAELNRCCACGVPTSVKDENGGAGLMRFTDNGECWAVAYCVKHRHIDLDAYSDKLNFIEIPATEALSFAQEMVEAADREILKQVAEAQPVCRPAAPWEWAPTWHEALGGTFATVMCVQDAGILYRPSFVAFNPGERYLNGVPAIEALHFGLAIGEDRIRLVNVDGRPRLVCNDPTFQEQLRQDIARYRAAHAPQRH